MSLFLALALLGLQQQASQTVDPERSLGDSELATPSRWNPDPEPSLASIGPEAFRFSTSPALRWGEAIIITIAADPAGDAIATIGTRRRNCYDSAHARCRLLASKGVRFAFCIAGDCSYRRFAGRVHDLLFDAVRMRQPDEPPSICLDGPGFVTELRESGQTHNRSGFCGETHPNNAIYRLIREGVGAHWPRVPYFEE